MAEGDHSAQASGSAGLGREQAERARGACAGVAGQLRQEAVLQLGAHRLAHPGGARGALRALQRAHLGLPVPLPRQRHQPGRVPEQRRPGGGLLPG